MLMRAVGRAVPGLIFTLGLFLLGIVVTGLVIQTRIGMELWQDHDNQLPFLRGRLESAKIVDDKDQIQLAKDIDQLSFVTRGTLAQIAGLIAQTIGGMVLLGGVWFAWQNLRVAQRGQISDRIHKAVEQLGSQREGGKPRIES